MTLPILFHVLAMFIAFALTVGVGITATAVAGTREVRAIRAATKIAQPLSLTGGIMLLVGAIFGFVAATSSGFDLGSAWLVVGYVCLGLLWIFGFTVHRTWLVRLERAALASPDDHPSAEVDALLGDRLVQIAGPVSGLVWITAIAAMVMKP
jgi:hypothetical protein